VRQGYDRCPSSPALSLVEGSVVGLSPSSTTLDPFYTPPFPSLYAFVIRLRKEALIQTRSSDSLDSRLPGGVSAAFLAWEALLSSWGVTFSSLSSSSDPHLKEVGCFSGWGHFPLLLIVFVRI